jgi:signal transduction histidine kinase
MPCLVDGHTWVCRDADTGTGPAAAPQDGGHAAASRAAIVVPLLRQQRLAALLVVAQRTPRSWTAQEVSLVEEVAERAWTAVERAKAEEALRVQAARYRADLERQVQERTAELQQSRDLLQATMDSALDMIQVFEAVRDEAGQIVDFRWLLNNHTSESNYGEVRGQSLLERNPGVVPEGIFADFKQVVETGEPKQTERHYVHEQFNGWYFQSIVKLGDGVATSSKDITDWKKAQAELLRLRLSRQQGLFEAVQAAQEAERRRIAEGLHNGIGQLLYATKLRLDQLRPFPAAASPEWRLAHREANQLLSEAIHQTRALSHELVPLVLEEFGLVAALQDISSQLSSPRLRLHCQAQLDAEDAPLSAALQLALYRMAQELAQNVVKHALGATEASLELETMPGWVLLRVEDNGPGFATLPPAEAGLGLRSIRDQVALLGGQLETGLVPAGGAYVRIRIPYPAPAAA